MATDDTLIVIVLDKSGSMDNVVDDTIDWFNAFVEEQRGLLGDTYLTLTLFDTTADCRFEAATLALLPAMARSGDNAYVPVGGTALYDGVGISIRSTEDWLKANPNFDGRIMVAIVTDGGENSSKSWRLEALNDLIKAKTDEGWEFAFLGSGSAAWTEGKNLAMAASNSYNFVGADTAAAYAGFTNSVSTSRATGQSLGSTMPMNAPTVTNVPTSPASSVDWASVVAADPDEDSQP